MLFFGQPEPCLVHPLNGFGQGLAGDVQVRQHQHPRSHVPVPQGDLVLRQRAEQPLRRGAAVDTLAEREQVVRVDPPAKTGLTVFVGHERLDELPAGQAHRRVECHVQFRRLNHRVHAEADDRRDRRSRTRGAAYSSIHTRRHRPHGHPQLPGNRVLQTSIIPARRYAKLNSAT